VTLVDRGAGRRFAARASSTGSRNVLRRPGALLVAVWHLAACGSSPSDPAQELAAPRRFLDAAYGVEVVPGIVYATAEVRSPSAGHIDLRLDLYRPSGPDAPLVRPGLVLVHGGGFTSGSRTSSTMVSLGSAYASRGYVCVSIDYRLLRDDPPTESLAQDLSSPTSVAAAAARVDASRAVEWLRANAPTYGVDPSRIAMGGYSAGAITTLGVAYRDPGLDGADVRVALSLSGALYGNEGIIDGDDPPLIMIHGIDDPTVPFDLAEAVRARATAVGLTLEYHALPGVGHSTPSQLGLVVDGVTLGERITNFLYSHLALEGL
jgi:acetyl esterase/lipase